MKKLLIVIIGLVALFCGTTVISYLVRDAAASTVLSFFWGLAVGIVGTQLFLEA